RTFDEVEELDVAAGSADIGEDSVLLSTRHQTGREVGETTRVTIGEETRELEIAGFFEDPETFGTPDVILSLDTVDAMGGQGADNMAFVFVEDDADTQAVSEDIEELISAQPLVT